MQASKKKPSPWSDAEKALLESSVATYKARKTSQDRKKYLDGDFREAFWKISGKYSIETLVKSKTLREEWIKKRKQIETWFRNNARQRKKATRYRFSRRISLKRVLSLLKKDLVEHEVRKLTTAEPGTQPYFGKYQKGLNKVYQSLTEEQLQEVKEAREKFEQEGLPAEEKARCASKYGRQCIQEMDKVLLKEFGMRCFTLEFHQADDGRLVYAKHDNTKSLPENGTTFQSFAEYRPNAVKIISKAFMEWAAYIRKAQAASSNPAEAEKMAIILHKTIDGIPLLPDRREDEHGVENLDLQKCIIRDFMQGYYALASGKPGRKVPWQQLMKNHEQFINDEYLPEGTTFIDPSKMWREQTESLLGHWRKRQNEGLWPIFQFSHWSKKNGSMVEATLITTLAPKLRHHLPQSVSNGEAANPTSNQSEDRICNEDGQTVDATTTESKTADGSKDLQDLQTMLDAEAAEFEDAEMVENLAIAGNAFAENSTNTMVEGNNNDRVSHRWPGSDETPENDSELPPDKFSQVYNTSNLDQGLNGKATVLAEDEHGPGVTIQASGGTKRAHTSEFGPENIVVGKRQKKERKADLYDKHAPDLSGRSRKKPKAKVA